MDAETGSGDSHRLPREFLAAVGHQAVNDAHLVGQLLGRVDGPDQNANTFPIEVLARLGVILRLAEWERLAIRAHQATALGSATENWLNLLEEIEAGSLQSKSQTLVGQMIDVLGKKILWDSENSDVRLRLAIESSLDDDALDALAAFLLENTLEPKS